MQRILKYFLYTLVFFTISFLLLFFNLGNILDITQKPIKSDIIVSLGGGDKERVKKAIELYNTNYSTQNILILTGESKSSKKDLRIKYIEDNTFNNINLINVTTTKNTKEEILFIKNFLLEKNFKSAIIVSDAPHSRRIQTLINLLKIDGDDELSFNIVATNTNWWNTNIYYKNKRAQNFAFLELVKLTYAYLAYGFLEKIGVLDFIENNYLVEKIKKNILKEYNSYMLF